MPGPFDFTDTNIQDTYQRVVQTDGTNFYDGTGSAVSIGQTDISALNAHTGSINAATSSFVLNSQTGSFVTDSQTGSFVINSQTGSFVTNSQTGSFVTNSQTGSFVTNSQTGSFVVNSQTGSFVTNSQTASFAVTGSDVIFNHITASGHISASGIISASSITATGNIHANRFKGDARDLTNVPNDLVWDGDVSDGYLTIVTCTRFAETGFVNERQSIPTSSLEWTDSDLFGAIVSPVIYSKQPAGLELNNNFSLATVEYIVFSGSNFGMNSALEAASPGLLKIDLNALDGDNDGEVEDVFLLGAIRDALLERRNNNFFNPATVGYNIQDSYLVLESTSQEPHQFAFSNFYAAEPANTEIFDFHYFISESNRRGGGNETTQIFNVTTNPNKVYSSLATDLDTTFSSSVEITGSLTLSNTTDLTVGGVFTATTITASGDISSSGTIVGSNLSGTNTGDQDLSGLVQNSATSSFVINSQTGSFVTNSQTASFAITGSDVLFANVTASIISASGAVTASGLLLPQLSTIEWVSNVGQSQTIKGTDNYIQIDGDNRVLISADVDISLTSPSLNTTGHITASGNISSSGGFIGDLTGTAASASTAATASAANKILAYGTSPNSDLALAVMGSTSFGYTVLYYTGPTFNPSTNDLSGIQDITVNGTVNTNILDANQITPEYVTSDGQSRGDVLTHASHYSGDNTNHVFGRVYQINGLTTFLAKANVDSGSKMIALAAKTGQAAMLTRGYFCSSEVFNNLTGGSAQDGDVLYMSTTSGRLTIAPTSGSGEIVRVVGYVIDASAKTGYFDPDKTWIET